MLFLLFLGAAASGGFIGYWLAAGRRMIGVCLGSLVACGVALTSTDSWGQLFSATSGEGLLLGALAALLGGRFVVGK